MTASTRLPVDRYLELLAADGERLAAVAHGHLDDQVPTCPDWTVADLVEHTGEVYHHKVACMTLGRRPLADEYEHAPAEGQDHLDWFRTAHTVLLDELHARPSDSGAYTWYPPEQDVGFWIRRMAQETVVHRVDAESAVGDVTPAADDLALDGIDEVLDLFVSWSIGADPDEELDEHDGRSFLIRTGSSAWHLSVDSADPERRLPLVRGAAPSQATITGEPSELLLWLWGRRPDSAVSMHGDPQALTALRDLLYRGTQ